MKKFPICLIVFFLIFKQECLASQSIQTSPRTIYIDAKAPSSISSPIIVENPTGEIEEVSYVIAPFSQSLDGGVNYLSNLQTPSNEIGDHIKLFDGDVQIQSSFTILPKESKTLNLRIDLTENQKESEYTFSILFITNPINDIFKNASYLRAGTAVNVILSVGSTASKAEIADFSAPLLSDLGPIGFSVVVKNTGLHAFSPKGYILIKNMFDQTVGKVDLEKTYILAGSSRLIPEDVSKLSSFELNLLSKQKKYQDKAVWPESITFGFYTADLYISYFPNGGITHETIRFFAFPKKYSLILISLIVFVAIVVKRSGKYKN